MINSILERLKKTIKEQRIFFGKSFTPPEAMGVIEELTPETRIWEDDKDGKTIVFDELDFIAWGVDIDKEFGIRVSDKEYNDVKTIGDIIRIVEKHIKEKVS